MQFTKHTQIAQKNKHTDNNNNNNKKKKNKM